MTTVIVPNETFADHLAEVVSAMGEMGAPVIRCYRDEAWGVLVALEGSHRVAAARQLGELPVFVELDGESTITCAEIGWDDMGWFDGEPVRVCDIAARMMRTPGPMIRFED